MSDFSIREMLTMQQTLQEKYKDKWETIHPEAGKHKLLWMVGEIGEVIDIVGPWYLALSEGEPRVLATSCVRI